MPSGMSNGAPLFMRRPGRGSKVQQRLCQAMRFILDADSKIAPSRLVRPGQLITI